MNLNTERRWNTWCPGPETSTSRWSRPRRWSWTRRSNWWPPPLYIREAAVEVVSNFRYLALHLSKDPTWSNNSSCLVRKAHHRLYFLRGLRHTGLRGSLLSSFYRCVVESVLCSCLAGQLLCGREECSAQGSESCTEDCWKQSPHHYGLHPSCTCTVSPSSFEEKAAEHLEQDHQTEELLLFPTALRLLNSGGIL